MGSELMLRLPLGWAMKPLIECTSDNIISYGVVQPGSHTETGIPIIRVNNFGNGKLDLSTVLKIEPEIEKKFSRTRLVGGEVLLTLVGSTGQSIVASKELAGWNVPRAVAVIRPSNDIGANWINICLQTEFTKHFLDSRANTTVQKTLNLADVKKIPIPIPPRDVKDFIESNIISLDNKIQLNRQTNQTLEAMAQALFKSWFVDFDPVFDNIIAHNLAHNNAPLHNIPEPLLPHAQRRLNVQNVARGSARQTAAHAFHHLFPQAFEQSDEPSVGIQGWVPKGWGAVAMESLVDIASSKRVFAKDYKEKGVPFFRGKEISELSKGNKINTEIFISEEKFEELKNLSGIPKEGDILITSVGTIGNTYQVTRDDRFYFKDGNLTWIKAYKKVFMPHFIMEWFRNSAGIEAIERIKIGTTQQAITIKGLNKILIVNAPKNILLEFEAICSSLYRKIGKNIKETSSLESLRDTLLPKLISGELRIPDAEQATEALAK